ncbi:MAG: shikimate dehydrogenase [Elusimicrobia bacterium]|nr:shikimate dehydrogenase [Elusimicrobiota bacterium]
MINANTKVIAIFGSPIEHSLSPLIQNAWLKEAGLNFVYTAFNVPAQNLKNAVLGASGMGFKGINITVPHKVNVLKYVDGVETAVKVIGAANTITIEDAILTAYNTDYMGCIADLKANKATIKNKKVFLYGAGGAARSVVYALKALGAKEIFVSNIVDKDALVFAKEFGISAVQSGGENKVLESCEVFINASSCGMCPKDKMHFEVKALPKISLIYDLIYGKKTPYLALAKKHKIKYVSGEGFLVRQAAEGFKLWTGIYPNVSKGLALLKKHA